MASELKTQFASFNIKKILKFQCYKWLVLFRKTFMTQEGTKNNFKCLVEPASCRNSIWDFPVRENDDILLAWPSYLGRGFFKFWPISKDPHSWKEAYVGKLTSSFSWIVKSYIWITWYCANSHKAPGAMQSVKETQIVVPRAFRVFHIGTEAPYAREVSLKKFSRVKETLERLLSESWLKL